MQTITVTASNKGNVTLLSINNKCIAHIGKDINNIGRYAGRVNHAGGVMCNNMRYSEAVEFITDAIERLFAGFGLDVKFE